MNSRNAIVYALLATAGSAASAGVFTWTGGSNAPWSDHTNWTGPVGLYPRLTVDAATISGASDSAFLSENISLQGLSILQGAAVYSAGHSMFVNGDINVLGVGSSLSVSDSASLRDLDVDNLFIETGVLVLYDGTVQIDESIVVDGTSSGGGILGAGTVEMNSSSGDFVLGKGAVWALDGTPDQELLITRTGSSTSQLDWTDPECVFVVWDGMVIRNELPYTGALGGRIQVSDSDGGGHFESDQGFVAGASSVFRFSGDGSGIGKIIAPVIDSYGLVDVISRGEIESPFVALRGQGEMSADATLYLDAGAMILDSFSLTASGPNTVVRFPSANSAVTILGGTTTFDQGETGSFDLDGSGNREITVVQGSSLEILAGALDTGSELFSGTLNIAGSFHAESFSPQQGAWHTNGQISMESGEITGRRFINSGTISGRGFIDTMVHNDGLIEAVGGTLSFDSLDPGGTVDIAGAGIVLAEQGDIVVDGLDSGGFLPTGGSISIGNGEGIREVFEMNGGLLVGHYGDDSGVVNMNSGFARFGRIRIRSEFNSIGSSIVTISGDGENDAIEFVEGTATINDSLEVRGNASVWADAQFAGSGTLACTSTVKSMTLWNGANTGGVSVDASGHLELGAFGPSIAQADTAGLTMQPTADFGIDIASDEAGGQYDVLNVAGDALLDGTLVVRWAADLGDAPVGETYTVVNADSIQGEFDAIDFSQLGTNRRAHVTVHPDSVEVTVSCLTDMNADGLLDLSDITSFVDAFTSGDMLADVAPPQGILDLNDINAFVFFFQGGCNQ